MIVRRAGFLSFVASIAAATSCASAGDPLPEPGPADAGSEPRDERDARAPSTPADDAAAACEDDDGITTTCDDLPEGTDVCSAAACRAALQHLKSRVARAEVECIRTQRRLGTSCTGCRKLVLEEACPDPSAEETCDVIESLCLPVSPSWRRTGCEAIAAGLTYAGRARFIDCVTEGACGGPLDRCYRMSAL